MEQLFLEFHLPFFFIPKLFIAEKILVLMDPQDQLILPSLREGIQTLIEPLEKRLHHSRQPFTLRFSLCQPDLSYELVTKREAMYLNPRQDTLRYQDAVSQHYLIGSDEHTVDRYLIVAPSLPYLGNANDIPLTSPHGNISLWRGRKKIHELCISYEALVEAQEQLKNLGFFLEETTR